MRYWVKVQEMLWKTNEIVNSYTYLRFQNTIDARKEIQIKISYYQTQIRLLTIKYLEYF